MPAVIAIVWGAALAVASGGRLRRLGSIQIPGAPVIVGLFLAQGIARGRLAGAQSSEWSLLVWGAVSFSLLLGLLLWVIPQSRQSLRRGVALVALGTALNLLVVLANAAMPISPVVGVGAQRFADFYAVANSATLLAPLGDVLEWSALGMGILLSAGDALLVVGVVVLLCESALDGGLDSSRG